MYDSKSAVSEHSPLRDLRSFQPSNCLCSMSAGFHHKIFNTVKYDQVLSFVVCE